MEYSDKMKLQERAAEGAEATFLLTEKFSGKWLAEMERNVLSRLSRAGEVGELVKIQADYRAARDFYDDLLSVSRKGREAAKKLHEGQTEH